MKAHESCVGRKPHEVKAKLLEDGRLVLRGVASYREFRSRLIETGEWDTAKIGVGGHVRLSVGPVRVIHSQLCSLAHHVIIRRPL